MNFWQPSAQRAPVKFLQPGSPFLFKLHSPNNFIAGGAFFVRFSALPAALAWEAFGAKNGVSSYPDLIDRVRKYRREPFSGDPTIGCNVLNGPFLWPCEAWIPVPPSWKSNIVQGRGYDTEDAEGRQLWAAVRERLRQVDVARDVVREPAFGAEYLARARLGQGGFRVLVTEAYGRRCAVTGERTLPVLQAAHVKPYSSKGPHVLGNGVLLRSDIHTLFDRGYVGITPDLRLVVSSRLKADFSNGREYYAHHGSPLRCLPDRQEDRPAAEYIAWHREHVFLGE